jgi:hypothetical protein
MVVIRSTVDVAPDWEKMFMLAVTLIKPAKFDGKLFVLEMLEYGARCYKAQVTREKIEKGHIYNG